MNADYGALNSTLGVILERINAAGTAVDATLEPVYFIVGCLLLVFACAKFMWQRDLAPLAGFAISIILLTCIVSLSSRWMPMTEGYMVSMGGFGSHIGGFALDQVTPAKVIVRGLALADKMYTENISWMRTIFGTTEDNIANIVMLLVCIGTIFVSVMMCIFLMMFFAVMKFATLVALVFLPFLLFEWSRFMAAPGVARILGYGVQMLVMSMVAGFMFATLDALELSDRLQAEEAIATFAIVAFFAFLFFNTTNIAREQISGMPVLSMNEAGNALGRGAMMAAGALGVIGGVGALTMASRNAARVSTNASGAGGMSTGGSAGGASGGMAGPRQIGAAPASAMRMINGSNTIDGTWSEAKDLGPKAAQRMLNGSNTIDGTWTDAKDLGPAAARRMLGQGQPPLPAPPRALPPPPRALPPPRS